MNEIKNFFLLLVGAILAATGIENVLYGSEPYSPSRFAGIAILIIGLSAVIISLLTRKRQKSFPE